MAGDARPRGRVSLARSSRAAPAPCRRRAAWRPTLAYGLAALAAAFALTMAASPDARSAVLEWLGLEERPSRAARAVAPSPRPGMLGAGLGLGTPVTLDEARARLALPAPAGCGGARPGRMRDLPRAGKRRAGLRRARRLRRAPADDRRRAARPGVPGPRRAVHREDARRSGARLERLRVDGAAAYFIAGSHGFAYERDGAADFEQQRIAGSTLLVERPDGLLIRVEGDITREQAVAVARSLPREM